MGWLESNQHSAAWHEAYDAQHKAYQDLLKAEREFGEGSTEAREAGRYFDHYHRILVKIDVDDRIERFLLEVDA